ncbi:MAG: hypothetical protein DSM106950_03370 [Stigonema ocellatum SAG 48.90 = DSM 106950]|nr:hypothetical protein [Stigonema ocellatum SAG 48.90 = DSM 106950]
MLLYSNRINKRIIMVRRDTNKLKALFADIETHVYQGKSGILTIVSDHMQFKIDIRKDESGNVTWGYELGHKKLMTAKLLHPGRYGLTLRTFLPLSYEQINDDGQCLRIPYKEVRGYVLVSSNDFQYRRLTAEEMEICHCTDAVTGLTIAPEKGVLYR